MISYKQPWSIYKEESKSRSNEKSFFQNHLKLLSPISSITVLPQGIHVSVVDALRVVRLIFVLVLSYFPRKTSYFQYLATNVLNYLYLLPGAEVHVVLEDYQYSCIAPSKNRDISE